MKNALGRNVLEGFKPYKSSDDYKNYKIDFVVCQYREL